MDQGQTFDVFLNAMTDEEKHHFKATILRLITCYGPNANQAVIIFKDQKEGVTGVSTLNADEMDAANLMLEANEFLGFLNMADAPAKEALN